MMINRKMLALLTAAAVGAGLAACQREEDRSASGKDATTTEQAPRQGYTGPGSPSTSPPPSSPSGMGAPAPDMSPPQSGSSGITGSPGSTNPTDEQKQPGSGSSPSQDPSQQR